MVSKAVLVDDGMYVVRKSSFELVQPSSQFLDVAVTRLGGDDARHYRHAVLLQLRADTRYAEGEKNMCRYQNKTKQINVKALYYNSVCCQRCCCCCCD